MSKRRILSRLSAFIAIIAWCVYTFSDLSILFSIRSNINSGIHPQIPSISFNLFLLALFIFYKLKIASADNINFIDLLWRVFVTGLITTLASLFFRFFTMMLGDTTLVQDPLFNRLLYNINLGLLSAVLISCFAVFRRLILYQKSKLLMNIWRFFNFSLLLSLAYDATYLPFLSFFSEYFRVLLILLSLYLSVNMKWVAYLNFKQKWKGLLLVTLALFYIVYFVWTLRTSVVDFYDFNLRFKDFQEHIFTMALIVFVIVYTLFSLLVILFNLPTSSVFEQKLEEVVNFQKLSQSIQTEQNEERVYDILLESSVSTVFADAAWFELTENGRPSYHCYQITEEEAISIKSKLLDSKVKGLFDQGPDKSKNASKVLKSIRGSRFNSLIGTPIIVKNKQIGFLMLLKEVSDGFNKEMEKIISTFANQAGISIENFRLLSEVLENERYKEELNIAKRVQSSLLPKTLHSNSDFEIIAFTHSATEVGGDYYDTFKIDDEKVAIIIGDVSGKGTSAAFHMSQMKGIFHSLSQVNPSPREFLKKANIALSECLEKSSFITISYFLIDQKTSSVKFSRAGHCPTLYYHANSKKAEYFKNKGMGLGLVRNEGYDKFIHVNKFNYEPGDLIILYTDGITEATNPLGNEYGYKRLESAVVKHAAKKPEKIMDNLLNDFYEFTGTKSINDDYTIVLIRFKKETN